MQAGYSLIPWVAWQIEVLPCGKECCSWILHYVCHESDKRSSGKRNDDAELAAKHMVEMIMKVLMAKGLKNEYYNMSTYYGRFSEEELDMYGYSAQDCNSDRLVACLQHHGNTQLCESSLKVYAGPQSILLRHDVFSIVAVINDVSKDSQVAGALLHVCRTKVRQALKVGIHSTCTRKATKTIIGIVAEACTCFCGAGGQDDAQDIEFQFREEDKRCDD